MNYDVMFKNINMKQAWKSTYVDERLKTARMEDFHPDRVAFILNESVIDKDGYMIAAQLHTREQIAEMKLVYATCCYLWSKHVQGIELVNEQQQKTILRVLLEGDYRTVCGRVKDGHNSIEATRTYIKGFYQ